MTQHSLAAVLTILSFFSLPVVITLDKTFGSTVGLIQPSDQHPGGAGDERDVHMLEPGKPINRELVGGQEHTYQISLSADQFLKVIVEQQGIDIVMQVSGPGDKQILEFDSESRPVGQESVSLVAEAAGDYRLTVQPKQKNAVVGRYDIQIDELRIATDTDHALHEARKLSRDGLKRGVSLDESLQMIEKALGIRERILGPEHPDVASTLHTLANIYYYKGTYAKAEQLFLRSLAIREKVLGSEHLEVARSLNNLAIIYRNTGEYAKVEPLHQRSLAIREKALGPEHLDVGQTLENLAIHYDEIGEYARAEPLYRRSLAIHEKALGPDHSSIAVSLNNLANLYDNRGEYAKAEMFYRRSLAIYEKALGLEHYGVSLPLHNLALLYRDRSEYAEAEPLFKRALDIREKVLGKDHPNTAATLSGLAALYYSQGKYAEAEPLCKRALDIREKALGKDHPYTAYSLNNLASLYKSQGKYAEAESLFKRALDINEKVLGKEHLDAVSSLGHLAVLYTAKGDLVQAINSQSLANAAGERNLTRNLVIGSERQKLAYLAILSQQTDQTITIHLRHAPDDPTARNLAATLILQRKGRALDATSENLNSLRSRFNTEDQALLDRLTETRSQLARLALGGPQQMTIEQYRDRIKALEDQVEKDESEISHRSSEFRAQSLLVTLEAVRTVIPPRAALIEFATYRPFNARASIGDEAYGQPRYVAYIVRHEGEILWKELGEAEAIDKVIAALRSALRNPKRGDVKRLARAVDAKVFQPLRPLLGDLTRLLISPDGQLNLIPFAALVDERGRYLIERYSISYLTSGRDLLRLELARDSRSGPLVVAAPEFGKRGSVEAAHNDEASQEEPKKQVQEESARSAFKEFYFTPLLHAAREGEALHALLPDATLLTKHQATKAALNQVRGPKLLHIATHGFFLKDQQLTSTGGRGPRTLADDSERLLRQLEQSGIRIENPLLRSGLALAGANQHEEDDNGILTALEVTGLNLWGTKLVVLSACDTGVGEVKNGDGVHGLRRALVLAGSETQVMSLWAIQDKATRDLMVAYYRRLKEGERRGEALRQVQLEMLKQVNRRHPYYWASFIQSGDWTNLEGE
jgi:CHAT domain-containing protein/Tfp pilus assembly protein PilF